MVIYAVGREERAANNASEASNWRIEIIQGLKGAAWEEDEKTFYGSLSTLTRNHGRATIHVYLLFSESLFSNSRARSVLLGAAD